MRISCALIVIFYCVVLLSGNVSAQSRQAGDDVRTSIRKLDKARHRSSVTQHKKENDFRQVYRPGPGDKLKISVYGEDRLSGIYRIDGNGTIALPLIGTLTVEGLRIADIRKRIVKKLEHGYLIEPSVTIRITKFRPFYIMGEVRKVGGYEYVAGITVRNAVAISGGFTHDADRDDIIIIRSQGESKRRLNAEPGTRVMPGDTIKVKESSFF